MSQTINDLLKAATAEMAKVGIEGPEIDARHLLAFALERPVDHISLHLQDLVDRAQSDRFFKAIEKRLTRKPVSQIIGERAFWKGAFLVTEDVLDPRPETELLVELGLSADFTSVLDLGTGSGCILLSLLADRPDIHGVGIDNSVEALSVAQNNANAQGLTDRVEFFESDWLEQVTGRFDLIVANPPYIRMAEMEGLSPEVRLWEPIWALTPGPEGLESYRLIAATVAEHLTKNGRLLLEIGPDQAADVSHIFASQGFSQIEVHRDLDGRDRVVALRR